MYICMYVLYIYHHTGAGCMYINVSAMYMSVHMHDTYHHTGAGAAACGGDRAGHSRRRVGADAAQAHRHALRRTRRQGPALH